MPRAGAWCGCYPAATVGASGGQGPLPQRLWPELAVHEADPIVTKTAASAFLPNRSELPGLPSKRGIDTVVTTGTVTNVCCESSARDASILDYRVITVADANAARRDRDHNATLYTVYRTFGDVRTTDEVLGLIENRSRIVPTPPRPERNGNAHAGSGSRACQLAVAIRTTCSPGVL